MKKFKIVIAVLVYLILMTLMIRVQISSADRVHNESWYQDSWCKDKLGIATEVILSDSTRADCVSDIFIVEFDFANKWYNGVSQTLHYSRISDKYGILILILEDEKEIKYVDRADKLIIKHNLPIDLFIYKGYGVKRGVLNYNLFLMEKNQ